MIHSKINNISILKLDILYRNPLEIYTRIAIFCAAMVRLLLKLFCHSANDFDERWKSGIWNLRYPTEEFVLA